MLRRLGSTYTCSCIRVDRFVITKENLMFGSEMKMYMFLKWCCYIMCLSHNRSAIELPNLRWRTNSGNFFPFWPDRKKYWKTYAKILNSYRNLWLRPTLLYLPIFVCKCMYVFMFMCVCKRRIDKKLNSSFFSPILLVAKTKSILRYILVSSSSPLVRGAVFVAKNWQLAARSAAAAPLSCSLSMKMYLNTNGGA